MRTLPLRALPALLALQTFLASPLPAQLRPYVGVVSGVGSVPHGLQHHCGAPNPHAALGVRAGLARGALALEAQLLRQSAVTTTDCVMAPLTHEDGVHMDPLYPFRSGELDGADVRLRYRPFGTVPLVVFGGAGRLYSHDLPYLVAGAGVRTGRVVRLVLDVERTEYRVSFDQVWSEWRDRRSVGVLRRERVQSWGGGWGLRAGVELAAPD